ncbi:CoA ester lyase [Ammoniphilus sp. YIM 78166]|uniref:HpcH/HpaI aldolase/citrate lyase family protein n=1 Tax=Ammoniphilus sp. YIM 78166 TaxID=1644106 RepID=UPI0010702958|nr:CoA ester lyase [Ammoniphilus sp. YIM 78166]
MDSLVYLFVPAIDEKKIAKAFQSSADAVILDLEDAIRVEDKANARRTLVQALKNHSSSTKKIIVRINPIDTPWFHEDLTILTQTKPDAVMLPKCESCSHIQTIASDIQDIEIIPLIESARGVWHAYDILQSSEQVKRLAFGSVDYALDIGTEWSEDGTERHFAMNHLVLASRTAGADSPIDAVFPQLDNKQAFLFDGAYGRKIGFYGKLIIHPKHINWVREVYRPNEEQMEWSKRIVEAFETRTETGAFSLDGKLIDFPVYKLAKKMVEMVRSL